MQFISTLDELNIKDKTAVSIGKFDGLHRGHQSLIEDVKAFRKLGYSTVIMTFSGISNAYINTLEEKHFLADKMGVDYFLELPFHEIRGLSATNFVEEILVKRLNLTYLSVGEDFRFGSNRSGNVEFLKDCAKKYGFELSVHSKLTYEGHEISSTYIKEILAKGDMLRVNAMLGYHFFIRGEVVHGTGIGSKKLGYPTINIHPSGGKLLPENGVYISRVVLDGKIYPAISNIGYKPTVSNENILGIESYILDENFDCYEKTVDVELLKFVRKEMKFSSLEALKTEITKNIQEARAFFTL